MQKQKKKKKKKQNKKTKKIYFSFFFFSYLFPSSQFTPFFLFFPLVYQLKQQHFYRVETGKSIVFIL